MKMDKLRNDEKLDAKGTYRYLMVLKSTSTGTNEDVSLFLSSGIFGNLSKANPKASLQISKSKETELITQSKVVKIITNHDEYL